MVYQTGNALVAAGRAADAIAPLKRAASLDERNPVAGYGSVEAVRPEALAAPRHALPPGAHMARRIKMHKSLLNNDLRHGMRFATRSAEGDTPPEIPDPSAGRLVEPTNDHLPTSDTGCTGFGE